jgi:hypothetical protein
MNGDEDRDQGDATNQGKSATEPAEGADDTPPPEEGSPETGAED